DHFNRILSGHTPCTIEQKDWVPDKSVLHYIDESLIYRTLKNKANSGPGPDGITSSDLFHLVKELQILLNWILRCKTLPDKWRASWTRLCPKKQSNQPQDYRPISVSSLMYRLD